MRKALVSLVSMLAVVGCSTTPISTDEAVHVPSDRVTEAGKKLLAPTPTSGRVVVKRDSGMLGSACSTRIYVDGEPVADIDTAEKIVLHLAEGEHIISAQPNDICSGAMTEVRAPVRKGASSAFRFGSSGNGSSMITPTAF